jgi:hypothetical protein
MLPGLEDEMGRHNAYPEWSSDPVAQVATEMRELEEFTICTNPKIEDAQPILSNHILALFLRNNFQLGGEPRAKKQDLLPQKLQALIHPIAAYAMQGAGCQFHSYLIQFLSLKDSWLWHLVLEQRDDLLAKIAERSIEQFCVNAAPMRVRALFSTLCLFTLVIHSLQRPAPMERPLEALTEIVALHRAGFRGNRSPFTTLHVGFRGAAAVFGEYGDHLLPSPLCHLPAPVFITKRSIALRKSSENPSESPRLNGRVDFSRTVLLQRDSANLSERVQCL